ncbi:efflux RND transporter permease subunit [Alkalihalophilus marmarensis]|jgi:HAE1 family hydrophobic/amphiphilic exporter-1|uniref:Cation transporter n=1 Tax=Alkalihalophilus marmarensis DSM 21297 TaxID=1188261 RepID=U6SR97_9BACI|nr:efflux RND transporter permease subunit [Alkalihalophilus marmarensis]ERN53415.1 cation transporter [Alkalihalophilus marmarensis DSM 21297]MCM3490845.1 efflux RND transporter permease subunit [Alkalihalophilus marmarensis]
MTNFSIRRPKFTIVAMLLFLIFGFVSVTNLPLQLFPNINPPVAAVVTSYSGASPEEVEDKVTKPLESQLATTSGLNKISSTTSEGMTLILLEFSWTTSIDDVELDIINTIRQTPLPDDANEPSFLKFDPSMMPMMQLAITGDDDILAIQDLVDDLRLELEKVPGVASIDEAGSMIEEVQINLNQDELTTNNLTQQDIIQTIQSHNTSMPGGTVSNGDLSLTTRVISELVTVEEIEELVVGVSADGSELTLTDVAEVEVTTGDTEVITRANQEPAIQFTIMKESESNTVLVSNAVNDRMDELLDDSKYDELNAVMLYDEGSYINSAIASVTNALIFGGILAMLVLFFFLRNLKTPLIVGIAIPFSIIVTFAFLYFAGIGLNLMSLGGLALGIGMLVDNAIVVIENIYRHLSMNKKPKQAALDGTKEVSSAIIASTLTTVSVFLPIVFISGLVANLFREFALAVSFSLLASLLVALTVVPMIASRILKKPNEDREAKRMQSSFMKGMDRSIRWVLMHRLAVLFITFILLVAGGLGLMNVGTELIPDSDQGTFTVDVELEQGTTVDRTQDTVNAIEDVLSDYREISDFVSTAGSSDQNVMSGNSGSHQAQIFVNMAPLDQRQISTSDFIESIESEVARVDRDAEISLSTVGSLGTEANTLVFTISDPNSERLYESAQELEEELLSIREVRDLELSIEETSPEIQIEVDRTLARENALAPAQIAQQVHDLTRGQLASALQTEDNNLYDILVQLDPEFTEDIEALENLQLQNGNGEFVALSEVAEIVEGESPATIQRMQQEEAVEFTVYYSTSTTLGDISRLVEEAVDEVELDEQTTFSYGGEQELLEDSIGSMALAVVLAIIFIYLVMAAQFESFKMPFVIMFTVPLVVIGVALALLATQTALSVTVFIGLIVLIGIVVNNAIVLVDYVNQRKASGMTTFEALVVSVKDRTRPILMTSLTTILGMVPLALGLGEGAELQQPMALAVIGGLISSTFLTLFVIPVVYSLFDKQTRRRRYVTVEGEFSEVDDRARSLPPIVETERVSEYGYTEQSIADSSSNRPENEALEDPERSEQIISNVSKDENSKDQITQDDSLSKDDILKLLEQIVHTSKENKKDKDQ